MEGVPDIDIVLKSEGSQFKCSGIGLVYTQRLQFLFGDVLLSASGLSHPTQKRNYVRASGTTSEPLGLSGVSVHTSLEVNRNLQAAGSLYAPSLPAGQQDYSVVRRPVPACGTIEAVRVCRHVGILSESTTLMPMERTENDCSRFAGQHALETLEWPRSLKASHASGFFRGPI